MAALQAVVQVVYRLRSLQLLLLVAVVDVAQRLRGHLGRLSQHAIYPRVEPLLGRLHGRGRRRPPMHKRLLGRGRLRHTPLARHLGW